MHEDNSAHLVCAADGFELQSMNAHAFEAGSRQTKSSACGSYDEFLELIMDSVGVAPAVFHLIDWTRAK